MASSFISLAQLILGIGGLSAALASVRATYAFQRWTRALRSPEPEFINGRITGDASGNHTVELTLANPGDVPIQLGSLLFTDCARSRAEKQLGGWVPRKQLHVYHSKDQGLEEVEGRLIPSRELVYVRIALGKTRPECRYIRVFYYSGEGPQVKEFGPLDIRKDEAGKRIGLTLQNPNPELDELANTILELE